MLVFHVHKIMFSTFFKSLVLFLVNFFFSFPVLDFSLVLVNSNSLGREVTVDIIHLMWEHPSCSQAGKTGSAAHLEFPS